MPMRATYYFPEEIYLFPYYSVPLTVYDLSVERRWCQLNVLFHSLAHHGVSLCVVWMYQRIALALGLRRMRRNMHNVIALFDVLFPAMRTMALAGRNCQQAPSADLHAFTIMFIMVKSYYIHISITCGFKLMLIYWSLFLSGGRTKYSIHSKNMFHIFHLRNKSDNKSLRRCM